MLDSRGTGEKKIIKGTNVEILPVVYPVFSNNVFQNWEESCGLI